MSYEEKEMSKLDNIISSFNTLIEDGVIQLIECNNCYYIKIVNNGKLYQITKFIANCITNAQCSQLDLTQEETNLINDCLYSLHKTILEGLKSNQSRYIHISITLFPKDIVSKISAYFAFLFQKKIFVWLSPLVLVVSVLFSTIVGLDSISLSKWSDVAFVYILLTLSLLIHEFGHAAGTFYYGIKPKEIGLGLYFVFPVLYTNVSEIWFLKPSKRIVVNFGGIYFQLITNLIFIVIYMFYNCDILAKAITMNNLICAYALLPFFRNDGYWIYSDYFQRNNLMRKDKFYVLRVLKVNKIDYVSLFFSIGNTLFLFYIIYLYIIIGNGIVEDIRVYFQHKTHNISYFLMIIFKISCYLTFLFLYIKSQTKQIIRQKRNV